AVAAPALDGPRDDSRFVAGFAPKVGEARVGRGGPLLGLEVIEPDPDRDRDAFAAYDALAVAQGRDRVEEAARAFGHRGADAGLVAVVVQTHRDDRAALRQDAFGKIRRTLRDEAERHAILTAFLGDPLEDLADGLAALRILVLRDVAVRLFADEEERALRLGPRPDRIVEHHSGEDRDNYRRDLRRDARDVDDRDRLAVARQAEQLGEQGRHRIRHQHA